MNEDEELDLIPIFEPEKTCEEADRKHILQLFDEEKYFSMLRNKHQFEDVKYENSWGLTVELLREQLETELKEYESRYHQKFEPSK